MGSTTRSRNHCARPARGDSCSLVGTCAFRAWRTTWASEDHRGVQRRLQTLGIMHLAGADRNDQRQAIGRTFPQDSASLSYSGGAWVVLHPCERSTGLRAVLKGRLEAENCSTVSQLAFSRETPSELNQQSVATGQPPHPSDCSSTSQDQETHRNPNTFATEDSDADSSFILIQCQVPLFSCGCAL